MISLNRKIVIATPLYPPDTGGPATYTKLLETELPNYGFEIKVVSFGEVRNLPKFIRHLIFFLVLIRRSRGFDTIFAQDPVSVGLPASLAAFVLRKRFILKIVGDFAWEQGRQRFGVKETLDQFVETKKQPFMVNLFRLVQSWVARRAKKIIVPSNYLKKIIMAWGIGSEKISVIYNSFEEIDIKETKKEIKKQLNLKDPTLISAGRLVPWKGFEMLIKIMTSLLKNFPELQLIIAGDGPEEKFLKETVDHLGLQNSVRFLGRVERGLLAKYVKGADIFILNTGYEGLSHQLLEVMSLGTPIITTNVGGNPELITDGKNGVLVPHNGREALIVAITSFLIDRVKAETLALASKAKSREFNKANMIESLVKELS